MWSAVLNDPQERTAFNSLLADYFNQPAPTSPPSTSTSSAPLAPPRSLPPPAPSVASPARSTPPAAPARTAPTASGAGVAGQEGPKRPAGLTSSRTTAGGFDASSKKSFAKGVFSSKGPMNRQEMEKQKQVGPLFVKSGPSKPIVPPPRRGAPASSTGSEERVKMLYDYEGAEGEDLPAAEGEELVVVEHV
ncbi:hypothetical protein JCM10207_002220 [Rhodosporidiobolus poonsookiae]